MTLEKIGQKSGITMERVPQLNVRAMKKLRSLAEIHSEEVYRIPCDHLGLSPRSCTGAYAAPLAGV